jgi:hypothetical protein
VNNSVPPWKATSPRWFFDEEKKLYFLQSLLYWSTDIK